MFPSQALQLDTASPAKGAAPLRRLALVGLTKNAGKTVALGRIAREARALGRQVALVSTGFDGERRDAVFGYAKPAVHLEPGTWVASALEGLRSGTLALEAEQGTGLQTPFGEITLARARTAGELTLIGPRTVAQLQQVLEALEGRGADLVLIDGSIDRRAFATPGVADGIVLVVGAAGSRDLSTVMDEAARVIRLLSLPETGEAAGFGGGGDKSADTFAEKISILDDGGQWQQLPYASALGNEAPLAAALRRMKGRALACPGAVDGELLRALAELMRSRAGAQGLRVRVEDGTKVFADRAALMVFDEAGGQLEARRALRLLGVAYNPCSPEGYRFSAEEMRERLQGLVPELPVFDAVMD